MHRHKYAYTTLAFLALYPAHCVSNTAIIDNNQSVNDATIERLIPFAQTVTNAGSVGTGNNVLIGKVGRTLTFKTLVAGSGITLTPSSTELQIAASSSTPSYAFVGENGTGLLQITNGSTVVFNRSIALTSDITYNTGTGNMTFANAGTYQITYLLSMGAPASFQLFLDGTLVSGTKFISSLGSTDTKNCGQMIIAITAGQVLSLRNTSGGTVTIVPVSNTSAYVRLSLIAQKVA